MKLIAVIITALIGATSGAALPPEFGTPQGQKFPGCTTTQNPGGCDISCDNGFRGSCRQRPGFAVWSCGYSTLGEGVGHEASGNSETGLPSPCTW